MSSAEIRTWIAMFLSAAAGWANVYALLAWRGRLWIQTYYGAIASIAWFYSAGYIFLITTGDRLAWSQFYSNLGPVVWVLVWMIPPIVTARTRRYELQQLKRISQSVSDSLEKRDDHGFTL